MRIINGRIVNDGDKGVFIENNFSCLDINDVENYDGGIRFLQPVSMIDGKWVVNGKVKTIDELIKEGFAERIRLTNEDRQKIGLQTKEPIILVVGNVDKIVGTKNDIVVKGNTGNISTASGDVMVSDNGYINGSVSTMSGDVHSPSIAGSVSTMSGDIFN